MINSKLDESYILMTKFKDYLKIDREVFGVAMNLFNYYAFFKNIRNFNCNEVVITCLILAMKIRNCALKLDVMLDTYRKLVENKKMLLPEILVNIEIGVLACVGFELDIDTPYTYIKSLIDILKKDEGYSKIYNEEQFIQIEECAMGIIDDSYRRPICMQFQPRIIAISALQIAISIYKEEESFNFSEFNKLISFVSFDELYSCISKIYLLIEKDSFQI